MRPTYGVAMSTAHDPRKVSRGGKRRPGSVTNILQYRVSRTARMESSRICLASVNRIPHGFRILSPMQASPGYLQAPDPGVRGQPARFENFNQRLGPGALRRHITEERVLSAIHATLHGRIMSIP